MTASTAPQPVSFYDAVGGEPTFRRLVARSYAEVALDVEEEVFGFFADARNLEAITPLLLLLLRFRVLTPPPIVMGRGTLIRYRLRLHGVPVSWRTEITHWRPPYRFVDEQRSGPYALWQHAHTFESDGEATVMRDIVRYRIGFGPLGARGGAALRLERPRRSLG